MIYIVPKSTTESGHITSP